MRSHVQNIFFLRIFQCLVEKIKYPAWLATYKCYILMHCPLNHCFHFFFPIINIRNIILRLFDKFLDHPWGVLLENGGNKSHIFFSGVGICRESSAHHQSFSCKELTSRIVFTKKIECFCSSSHMRFF